ncbi:MAG: hypothetical protein ACOX2R_04695 [Anaerolineae bacterium]|jgi:hypothetical protein
MDRRLPIGLWLVALFQWIAPMIKPPSLLASAPVALWAVVALVFGLVAVNLLRRRSWSHTATVFIQGFSILVHLLVLVAGVATMGESGPVVDYAMLGTFAASMVASAAILYYVDLPVIRSVMQ